MKVQRCDVTDALTRDGEAAVLVRGKVLRLSEVSAAIWSLTEVAVDIESLARGLEASFGVPADRSSLDATKDAVTEMIRHGVLRVRD